MIAKVSVSYIRKFGKKFVNNLNVMHISLTRVCMCHSAFV